MIILTHSFADDYIIMFSHQELILFSVLLVKW